MIEEKVEEVREKGKWGQVRGEEVAKVAKNERRGSSWSRGNKKNKEIRGHDGGLLRGNKEKWGSEENKGRGNEDRRTKGSEGKWSKGK